MKKKVILGCLIVGVLNVAAAAGLYWLMKVLLVSFEVTTQANEVVEIGSVAELVVDARNQFAGALTLESIDIDKSLLAGFEVIAVDPPARRQEEVPRLKRVSWKFWQAVSSDETRRFTFKLKAVAAGSFTGTVRACDLNDNCPARQVHIVVTRESGASAEAAAGEAATGHAPAPPSADAPPAAGRAGKVRRGQ